MQSEKASRQGSLSKLEMPVRFLSQTTPLHNIKDKEQRSKALSEMLRVLKPEGKFAIADIQRSKEYVDFLSAKGAHVECSKPTYAYCPPITIVKGRKP
jgi:ubiquinone/menaquinone biosynthesis C-methylase UbiE